MFLLITPKVFKRRCKKVIYPEKNVVGEKYYFSLTLPIIKGNPEWHGLCTEEKLLLPQGIIPPPRFSVYGDYDWQLALTAQKLKKRLIKEKCDLVFVDMEGRHGRLVSILCEYARNIAVITNEVEHYRRLRNELYSGLGCYIEINSTLGLMGGFVFFANGEPDRFIRQEFRPISVNSLTEDDIAIPTCFLNCFPENISKCALSEALYSCWGVGRLGDYVKNFL